METDETNNAQQQPAEQSVNQTQQTQTAQQETENKQLKQVSDEIKKIETQVNNIYSMQQRLNDTNKDKRGEDNEETVYY